MESQAVDYVAEADGRGIGSLQYFPSFKIEFLNFQIKNVFEEILKNNLNIDIFSQIAGLCVCIGSEGRKRLALWQP